MHNYNLWKFIAAEYHDCSSFYMKTSIRINDVKYDNSHFDSV
jgi:hypothetical protein